MRETVELRNATVYDGSGSPPAPANVLRSVEEWDGPTRPTLTER